MNMRPRFYRPSTLLVLLTAGHPILGRAQASAPSSGKGEIICAYLRAPPDWDGPSPALYAFLGLVAFFAFCAVVVLIQSSRRNRVLEEQVAALMKAKERDLPGISNRS